MHKLNKKGLMFEVGLVLFAIIILSVAFYNITTKQITQQQVIGKSVKNLVEIEKESQLKLSFIEQSALFIIYNSISEFGENSGFSIDQKTKPCKTWHDYKLKTSCILSKEKLQQNLKSYIDLNFKKFTDSNSLNNYKIDLDQKDNKIIVKFNSNLDLGKGNINYFINHKFQEEINFDLNNLITLYNKYNNIALENCPKKEELEDGLNCKLPEEKPNVFLIFTYKKERFYLSNSENSFLYPKQPELVFLVPKIQKVEPTIQ